MSEFLVRPARKPLGGPVGTPADKSISHRAAILAALCNGETRVHNFLASETTGATIDCLRALGADIGGPAQGTLQVTGRGLRSLRESGDVLFCKGSGTTIRLFAGLCAGQPFLSILDGAPALKRRPMGRVVEPLRRMGAEVMARSADTLPPLAVRGGRLRGIEHGLEVASAQVKSALLLAGLYAEGPTTVREPAPSRDHTERMLAACGVEIERLSPVRVCLRPPRSLSFPQGEIRVPGDFSSAAFLLVAGLLVSGSALRFENVGLNPTRTGLLDVLRRMGARFEIENERVQLNEALGDLAVCASDGLDGVEVRGELVPRMIDEFPILAVAATQAHGETRVHEAKELRVKESDRIAALTAELRKLGAEIEPSDDGFTIRGPIRLRGARVSAHNDHRLAMSLAVAGLIAEGETVIEGWECVADSYPDFEKQVFTLQ